MRKGRKIRINVKKLTKISAILIVAVLLIGALAVFPATFSRYVANGSSEAKVKIAFSLLRVDDLHHTIKLDEILPNDQYQEYTFAVRNYDESGTRIDVNMNYTITLRTTTNIPITYELYDGDGHAVSTTNELVTDDYGTIFNTAKTTSFHVTYHEDSSNVFVLKYKLSSAYHGEEYAELADLIEIIVDAEQEV